MLDAAACIGSHDILLITLDTLRFDVAERALAEGRTPMLARVLPGRRWEKRHSPGSFTWAAHQAFFAGFLPTPAEPGPHERLFALAFPGSETTGSHTAVFDAPDLITGLRGAGYHSICVGGVGFFNELTPLGRVLPNLFDEHRWTPAFGVTDPDSTAHQVAWACERADGGRGFGFTGGHFHQGWANNDQRKLVLNAILWTAKAKIPVDGVASTVTDEDMKANLDLKPGQGLPEKPKKVK